MINHRAILPDTQTLTPLGHHRPTQPDTQTSLSPLGQCLTLTRYKLIGGFLVFAFSLLFTFTTMITDRIQLKENSNSFTSCSLALKAVLADRNGSIIYLKDENSDVLMSLSSEFTRRQLLVGPVSGNAQKRRRRNLKKRLPSAIVIGARKAGTRALLRFINLHPDVVTSRHETHFFDRYYDEGLEWYRHQMPFSFEGQITIEKTPNYFVDWEVPERVYNFNSSIRLILIIRNPIDRAISDYVQLKEKFYKNGHEEYFSTFEELAFDTQTGRINKSYAPIKRSLYCRHLDKWLNFFPLSQLLVVDGENLRAKPWEEMYKLETFLGLPHKISRDQFVYNKTKGFYCIKLDTGPAAPSQADSHLLKVVPRSEQCLTDSKGRNHPTLNLSIREELTKFFKPFNNRFFVRIGREFNWS